MPRTSPKQRETEAAAIGKRVRHYYDDLRRKQGSDNAARVLGFPCVATLYNRFSKPNRFTLSELQAIASAMNISLTTLLCGREDGYEKEAVQDGTC